jgi:uncharacterized protein YgiM (DUF1202 family)
VKDNFFCKKTFLNLYEQPSYNSKVASQIIYGEKFKILSKNKKWVKIKNVFDNYVGYVKHENFSNDHRPTHKICNLKANIFQKSKSKTKNFLPFGAKISIINRNKKFVEFEKNKWVKKTDIKKLHYREKNFVKIFKKFLNVKYVWGGKTFQGIDCSALLQIFFYYNNSFYPRDTKDQIKYTKKNLKKRKFKKGDIIFWKGHVAMCLNSKQLIHAYGPKKKVIIMLIIKTINRIQKTAKLKVKKISRIKY